MSIQQNGKLSPVEFHELQRRMLEVLDLRAQIATLEKKAKSKRDPRAGHEGNDVKLPCGPG
jgi:hypothetical protein